MLDDSHPIIRATKALLQTAFVVGDSFSALLPPPRKVHAAERPKLMASARRKATDACLRALLDLADLPEDTPIQHNPAGDRHWPNGFTGSVSHKGAVVLAVMGPLNAITGVGIDLERNDDTDLTTIDGMNTDRDLPSCKDKGLARLVAFAAKEATFKAQFPQTQARLKFADVRLSWQDSASEVFQGLALDCPCSPITVRCVVVTQWVVAVATLPT